MCFTLSALAVKTWQLPKGRWRVNVKFGVEVMISAIHCARSFLCFKIASNEPIMGYEAGTLVVFETWEFFRRVKSSKRSGEIMHRSSVAEK